jgi:hypothetical protein
MDIDDDGDVFSTPPAATKPPLPLIPSNLSTKEQFKAMLPEAMSALRRVLNNTDSSDAATISAVTQLFDRAEGKQAASADAGTDKKLEITVCRRCDKCQAEELIPPVRGQRTNGVGAGDAKGSN